MINALKQFQSKISAYPDGIFGKNSLLKGKEFFNLTNEEAAHFFGQCFHETAGFKLFEENLHYSKSALLRVFGKYFDEQSAEKYQFNEVEIANIVYANRMGNSDYHSGEGFKFRGRGAIQLTGKNNYQEFGEHIRRNVIDNPDLVSGLYAFDSAIFYFIRHDIFQLCKDVTSESIAKVTKKVNGGYNGLEHRTEVTNYYYKLLTNAS